MPRCRCSESWLGHGSCSFGGFVSGLTETQKRNKKISFLRPLLPSWITYGVEMELCYPCDMDTVQQCIAKDESVQGWRCVRFLRFVRLHIVIRHVSKFCLPNLADVDPTGIGHHFSRCKKNCYP